MKLRATKPMREIGVYIDAAGLLLAGYSPGAVADWTGLTVQQVQSSRTMTFAHPPRPIPGPDEIERRATAIRNTWTYADYQDRLYGPRQHSVEKEVA